MDDKSLATRAVGQWILDSCLNNLV